MKMKYLVFAIAFALLNMGCSDKKEEPQSQQASVLKEQTLTKELTKKKKYKIPLDSSQIVTLKDFDPNDSISVGVRAFRAAKKEFVKRWNYTKDTDLFIDVVDKICLKSRHCAAMMDSVAYKNDVTFILDSLMRNNLLDKAVEERVQEMNGPCFGDNYKKNEKKCQEEISNRVYEKVMKEMKGIK
jgi:hypothetical protein